MKNTPFKNLILLIGFLTISSDLLSQLMTLDHEKFKGEIKSVKETFSDLDEKGEVTDTRVHLTRYDKRGRLISHINYSYRDSSNRTKYVYDAAGNCEIISNNISNAYEYDEKNNFKDIKRYYLDSIPDSHDTYKYDEKYRRIEANHYNESERLLWRLNYFYDEKGNLIEEMKSNEYLKEEKNKYKYDDKGNRIEEEFIYYKNGQRDEEKYYKNIIQYDEKGQKTEVTNVSEKGDFISKTLFTYDEKGNHLSITNYDSMKKISYADRFAYEFDETGNWVKKFRYENDKLVGSCERILTYY